MTRAQLSALPQKSSAVVIVPCAAIEQHGPHLPLGVDAILGQRALTEALALLPASAPVYVGPSITYGKSTEHLGFPGTITLSGRTLHRLIRAIARQVRDLGFRTLVFFNTHGGNSAVLVAALREIQTEFEFNAGMVGWTWKPPVSAREAAQGFHAGQWETSLMLAAAPHLVRMNEAVCEYPPGTETPGDVRPENAAITWSWMTHDISRSGVIGDATKGDAREGAEWLHASARELAAHVLRWLECAKQENAPSPQHVDEAVRRREGEAV
jgi:creatinine amidohydrolase